MELLKAHKQWANRPEDERFADLKSLYEATKAYANVAVERTANVADIRTEAIDGDVQLVGKQNVPAKLTHWAFGQLSTKVGAPASYLRNLPATLAAQNLNHGLKEYGDKTDTASLLFHQNGSLLCRAFLSTAYSRIWNYEVAERLLQLESHGWKPARPDFNKSIDDFPSLYASDHDMFAFVCNDSAIIREPGNPDGLKRGVIVENSEVGASALKLTRFLYRAMCGNHIIWGASKVLEISVRHVGNARDRWGLYRYELQRYAESSANEDESKIASAKTRVIGSTKEEVLDKLFGIRSLGLSRKALEAGYDAALPAQDGNPNTVWGMVQGLTRYSQTQPYADTRTAIDRSAGKLLEVGTF
jgi:hypothetical protein